MRLYEMFIGDFEKAAPWSPKSIKGCRRFLERVWALADKVQDGDTYSEQHEVLMNRTIKKVGEDVRQPQGQHRYRSADDHAQRVLRQGRKQG